MVMYSDTSTTCKVEVKCLKSFICICKILIAPVLILILRIFHISNQLFHFFLTCYYCNNNNNNITVTFLLLLY